LVFLDLGFGGLATGDWTKTGNTNSGFIDSVKSLSSATPMLAERTARQ
jgi:hypothetical protein